MTDWLNIPKLRMADADRLAKVCKAERISSFRMNAI